MYYFNHYDKNNIRSALKIEILIKKILFIITLLIYLIYQYYNIYLL